MTSVANLDRRQSAPALGTFERYLTVWVALCIVAGIILGQLFPAPFQALGRMNVAEVNIPVAVLIWLMIVPMLLKVDFGALHLQRVDLGQEMGHPLGRPELTQHQHVLARLLQGGGQGLGNRCGEVGMLGCEGIEAASIKRAGLNIGERLAIERVLAVIVEIAHAIARCANSDDLPASVIEGARDCHDARPDLEERAHGGVGAKDGLVLLPATDTTESKHHLQTGTVERLAQVKRPANASVTR
jgi:hypothetical protein